MDARIGDVDVDIAQIAGSAIGGGNTVTAGHIASRANIGVEVNQDIALCAGIQRSENSGAKCAWSASAAANRRIAGDINTASALIAEGKDAAAARYLQCGTAENADGAGAVQAVCRQNAGATIGADRSASQRRDRNRAVAHSSTSCLGINRPAAGGRNIGCGHRNTATATVSCNNANGAGYISGAAIDDVTARACICG